ncbi:MAG: DUF2256 domain-containing protein [Actinomycetota bacterium]|nr:DUF2256 domain-containing protein [Actinomycetota bacterium]
MGTDRRDFKGNKSALPSKTCAVCGRTMTWRKAWARNWDEVRYCSDGCRRRRSSAAS